MDALHAFGVHWKLLVIQMINFAVLLVLLERFVYRPLLKVLDERAKKVADAMREADETKVLRSRATAEREAIILNAREEANTLATNVRAAADEKALGILHDAQARAEAALHDARIRAEGERVETLRAAEKEIAKLALLGAEKILRERATS